MHERPCWRRLERPVTLAGVGLHSGEPATLTVAPAQRGLWLRGVRIGIDHARPMARRSRIVGQSVDGAGWQIDGSEHVLAALAGVGIFDAALELEGDEMPALDGSAAELTRALLERSTTREAPPQPLFEVVTVFERSADAASCAFEPASGRLIDCAIDFDHPAIGAQRRTFGLGNAQRFAEQIAPARTFGFLRDAEALHAAGLARGAGLDNALVFDDKGPMVSPRFDDEPVRHKILDAIGDLALLGGPLLGKATLWRCSHALLLRTLQQAVRDGAIVERGR